MSLQGEGEIINEWNIVPAAGWGHAATWLRINCLITTRHCVSNCDDSIQLAGGRGVAAPRHHRNCFTGPPEATWGEAAPAPSCGEQQPEAAREKTNMLAATRDSNEGPSEGS